MKNGGFLMKIGSFRVHIIEIFDYFNMIFWSLWIYCNIYEKNYRKKYISDKINNF